MTTTLHAYNLDMLSLRLMYSYLINTRQRFKKILFEVQQSSILGSLLCNIFIELC